jgi:hypothetical protein
LKNGEYGKPQKKSMKDSMEVRAIRTHGLWDEAQRSGTKGKTRACAKKHTKKQKKAKKGMGTPKSNKTKAHRLP